MVGQDLRRRHALALTLRAMVVTRERSLEEATACNARFTRSRDWLMHAPAQPIVGPGVSLTEGDMDALRSPAVAELRAICHTCGMCPLYGLKPP